jgi:hypothetical protein
LPIPDHPSEALARLAWIGVSCVCTIVRERNADRILNIARWRRLKILAKPPENLVEMNSTMVRLIICLLLAIPLGFLGVVTLAMIGYGFKPSDLGGMYAMEAIIVVVMVLVVLAPRYMK